MTLKVVCISDTHMGHCELYMPPGDILVVAGDISGITNHAELIEFNRWLGELDYEAIFVVPGNHDGQFWDSQAVSRSLLSNATVLIDEMVEYKGYKIYGSPWVAQYGDWWYMVHPDALYDIWQKIPDDIDILITHQPPYGILDGVRRGNAGCKYLREAVLTRIKPKLHVYGHLHLDGGRLVQQQDIYFVNAAMNNESYNIVREPITVELYQDLPEENK